MGGTVESAQLIVNEGIFTIILIRLSKIGTDRTNGLTMQDEQQDTEYPLCRVLVVDDEPLIRELLVECLEIAGLDAETADCGPAALKLMETESFDLVLTDMKMPEMTGLELIRRIQEKGGDTATIMMTGFGTVESAIEAMKLGAFDYILKPFKKYNFLDQECILLRQ